MYRSSTSPSIHRQFEPCSECNESCQRCLNKNSLYLQHEIEELRAHVVEGTNRQMQMESDFSTIQRTTEIENGKLTEELTRLRDRYDRLLDSHKKLQKCNHNLECKLLNVVERYEADRKVLMDKIDLLHASLVDAKVIICDLQDDSERNRNDCNLAVQLLQCRPSNFVSHKLSSLPADLQLRIKSQLSPRQIIDMEDCNEALYPQQQEQQQAPKVIRVPMATYPPTAIVYSVNRAQQPERDGPDTIPSAIIARVLAKPESRKGGQRGGARVVICGRCMAEEALVDRGVQTNAVGSDVNESSASVNEQTAVRDGGGGSRRMTFEPKVHRSRYNSTESSIGPPAM